MIFIMKFSYIYKNGPSLEEPFHIKPLQCPCECFTTARMPIPLGWTVYLVCSFGATVFTIIAFAISRVTGRSKYIA